MKMSENKTGQKISIRRGNLFFHASIRAMQFLITYT